MPRKRKGGVEHSETAGMYARTPAEMATYMRVSVFVSESDLWPFKSIVEAAGLETVLYEVWGFDNTSTLFTNGWWEAEVVRHRNRAGKVVECLRYVGVERMDKEWLKSGYASDQVKIASKGDISLLQELRELGARTAGEQA